MVRGLIRNQIDKVKSTAEYYKNEAPGWLNKNLNALEEKYPKVKETKTLVLYYKDEAPCWAQKTYRNLMEKYGKWLYRLMAYIWLASLYYSAPLVLTITAISWYCDRKKRQNRPAIDQLLPINERRTVLITGTNTTKGTVCFAF